MALGRACLGESWQKDGDVVDRVIGRLDVLCRVVLVQGALSEDSVQALANLGVVVQAPTRDKSLPGRTSLY